MFAGRTVYKVVFEYSLVDEYIKIDSPVIVDQMVLNRYKPVGWRSESYRHYLAAKGMKTRYTAHKYFAKGNYSLTPEDSKLKSAYAQNLTKEQAIASGIVDPTKLSEPQKYEKIVDVSNYNVPSSTQLMDLPQETPVQFKPIVAEPIPQIEAVPAFSPEVVEAPLQQSSELEAEETPEVMPIETMSEPITGSEEGEMTGNVATVPAPQIVTFDNFGSS